MKELKIRVNTEGKLAIVQRLEKECVKGIYEHNDGRRYSDYVQTFVTQLENSIRYIGNQREQDRTLWFIYGARDIMNKYNNCRGRNQALNAMKEIAIWSVDYLF